MVEDTPLSSETTVRHSVTESSFKMSDGACLAQGGEFLQLFSSHSSQPEVCWALELNENHPEGVGPVWGQEVLEGSSNFVLCEIGLDGRWIRGQ